MLADHDYVHTRYYGVTESTVPPAAGPLLTPRHGNGEGWGSLLRDGENRHRGIARLDLLADVRRFVELPPRSPTASCHRFDSEPAQDAEIDDPLDRRGLAELAIDDALVCRSGSLRSPDYAGGAALGRNQALMSVCPSDPVANAHLALNDFYNFALATQGADLRRVDDDGIARLGWHGRPGCATDRHRGAAGRRCGPTRRCH